MPLVLATPSALDAETRAQVHSLAAATEDRDGEPPLSDQVLTHLASTDVRHVIACDDGTLRGYAQLDGTSLELVGDAVSVAVLLDEFAAEPVRVCEPHRFSFVLRIETARFLPMWKGCACDSLFVRKPNE